MIAVHSTALKRAMEAAYGGTATFVRSVPVHETRNGRTVWNGAVQVFDLVDGPGGATRAYAWSSTIPGNLERQINLVLHQPPVTGPREAVAAAIVAEMRSR